MITDAEGRASLMARVQAADLSEPYRTRLKQEALTRLEASGPEEAMEWLRDALLERRAQHVLNLGLNL